MFWSTWLRDRQYKPHGGIGVAWRCSKGASPVQLWCVYTARIFYFVFLILLPFHCALLFAIFLLLENDIANPFSIFVLIFIEFVRIGLSIHLALSGNVSAWRAKLYMSIKQYRSEQIRWLMIRLLLFPILFLLFMLINRSGLK